ncbi:MAG: DUF2309 domain-containing protein [Cyclobacteriaceae bacterium]|nr:DUF2309 domain-containing protein [Cyclobacteriaceae bacterium]
MKTDFSHFDEHEVLHELKHYLPAQASLKDFIHHNTLHAFQKEKFHGAIRRASEMLGYKVSLKLEEFRDLYATGKIRPAILERIIAERKGVDGLEEWKARVLTASFDTDPSPRIGQLRANWKRLYKIDLDSLVHPTLFRVICSYLDQGIAMWRFPVWDKGFLSSMMELERKSLTSFFRTERARNLLISGNFSIEELLDILIGDKSLYAQYLFDQQFAHQGWSGMVSVVEDQPETLLDRRNITLRELIIFELLLEIDALIFQFGDRWEPLNKRLRERPVNLFDEVPKTSLHEVLTIWQEAYEWSYYDEVLAGVKSRDVKDAGKSPSFQGLFCIDDRECSLRRYLEKFDPACETFGTPGFFSVEFYFQPENGKFYTKVCPAPVTPRYLIKETGSTAVRETDAHFTKHSHTLFRGWLISQTLGFWAALKLFINIFRPTMSPATASSFRHMDHKATLTIENRHPDDKENGLQIGFTVAEMAQRVEGLLMSIGLVRNFAPVVYLVGHGSSSVNNPHYAAYDCGACSGRPGSVNARVMCYMANHAEVRKILAAKGIHIPETTQFLGGLHDTTRDEIQFFDVSSLTAANAAVHRHVESVFAKALDFNAKERSRRFVSVNTHRNPDKVHEEVRLRSVSLFEPRPELNHATNALCVVGRRGLTRDLFLDRRAFMNSYDYRIDPEGKYLLNILRPAAPVCGGINLEYFFSRVDNKKLGAGTKLPHNVMGLFGVANGIDGDLRPGLPSQMIEVHDPVRLLIIVEHFPNVVVETIQRSPETYEWFINEWVHLAIVNPETHELSVFRDGRAVPYKTITPRINHHDDVSALVETSEDNLPVYELN